MINNAYVNALKMPKAIINMH